MIPYLIAGAIGFVVGKLLEEDDKTPKYADGGSVLLAPNGKPSNLTPEQYKLVRTKAFKKWFGDWQNDPENASKVVDENGEPLPVYHGGKTKFNIFSPYNQGHYFTDNIKYAKAFTEISEDGHLFKCFINVRNYLDARKLSELTPSFEINEKELIIFFKKNGIYSKEMEKSIKDFFKKQYQKTFWSYLQNYGIYIPSSYKEIYDAIFLYEHSLNGTKINVYFVHESNQIKLADGTNTTFDGENPDIRYAGGGEIESVIEQVKLEVNLSYYKQNIQYHSLYPKLKNLNFFDDDEKVTSILVKSFINDVKAKSKLVNGKIRLYRALAIKNIEKLNVEKLGIYWSVNEDKTGVFDDEGYEHKEKPNYKSVFIIRAEFNTKDIDWQNSFDLYVMNDWMEGEIRVVSGSEAYNLKIKKSGDKKWLNI